MTMMPQAVIRPLQDHLQQVRAMHEHDLADVYGRVELPHALARKYPNANRQWGWQRVVPQGLRWRYPNNGEQRRHQVAGSEGQCARCARIWPRIASIQFRAYPRTGGDCPNFAVPWEQNGTVPLSETVFG
jgi:hypothetical protein